MKPIIQDDRIKIIKIETAPYGTNAYVLICNKTGQSVLIDAPGQTDKIIKALDGTSPRHILITHSHFDHMGALVELKSILKIPVGAHPADAGRMVVSADMTLNDGDTIDFGEISLKVLHTPGHTSGSLCFLTGKHLISGDTLFPGGPGKTGSPQDFSQILNSISEKLMILPGDTQVFPGHGESTVIEKELYQFKTFTSKRHPADLCGDVIWLSK